MTWWMLVILAVWSVGFIGLVLAVREEFEKEPQPSAVRASMDGLAMLVWPLTLAVVAALVVLAWFGRGGRRS